MRSALAHPMLGEGVCSNVGHVVAGFSAAIVLATSTVVVAEHTDHVPSSSIKPHSQLWTYEAPAKYGETPDERLSCGPSALERGKFVLESWGRFWCGPLDEATRTRECAVGRKPYDDAQVSFARAARASGSMNPDSKHLVMAYRQRHLRRSGFAEMRRQRAFLDRIGTIDCETHGPRKVWHPKKRSPVCQEDRTTFDQGRPSLAPARTAAATGDRDRMGIHDGGGERRGVHELWTQRSALCGMCFGYGDGV